MLRTSLVATLASADSTFRRAAWSFSMTARALSPCTATSEIVHHNLRLVAQHSGFERFLTGTVRSAARDEGFERRCTHVAAELSTDELMVTPTLVRRPDPPLCRSGQPN